MAEVGEWTRKGATLSDVTALKEYGVDRTFIIEGIEAGKLEYRQGSIWGNPYIKILRSQLEKLISEKIGPDYLLKIISKTELLKIDKEISILKNKLQEIELRKLAIQNQIIK